VLAKAVTEADRFEREATDEEVELRMRVMEEVHKVVGSSLSGFIEEVQRLDAGEVQELSESVVLLLGGFHFDSDVWWTVKGREVLAKPYRELNPTGQLARREEIRAAMRSVALEVEAQRAVQQRTGEVSERQDRSTHQLVANVWRDVADVTFPGFSEQFDTRNETRVRARFFDGETGELQGFFEREVADYKGEVTLDFTLNFRFDLPRMFRGGGAELIPGKGTPTHMAVTFQMMRMLELQPNALVYARGKQIQNLETAACVAQLRTEGLTLLQAAEQTHTHRYITATLLGLGYNAQLESVATSGEETRLVEDIAYFQNNRRFWDSEITPGRTRLQDFLERYDLGLESKLEMDWDFIYRLYAIGEET
ncbi:MAG: hypothetical protein AAF219_11515, partial [Myxococcota bacterium]